MQRNTEKKISRKNLNLKFYKCFCYEDAIEWGKFHYSDWLPRLQNQDYKAETPCENEMLFAPNIRLKVIRNLGKYIECIVER